MYGRQCYHLEYNSTVEPMVSIEVVLYIQWVYPDLTRDTDILLKSLMKEKLSMC